MNNIAKTLEEYTIYITIFLFPFVFLPTFFNPFATTKIAFLVFGVGLALFFHIIRVIGSGVFEFNLGSFDVPVLLLIVVYLISGIFASPNPLEAFFLPGVATIFIASGIMYYLVNQLAAEDKNVIIYTILISGLGLASIYILSLMGLFESNISLPEFMRTRGFTPQGALLTTATILLVTIPYGIGLTIKTHDQTQKVLLGCITALITVTLIISSFFMITDKANFRLASFNSSLSIVFDSLKHSTVLGVGPSNYLSAYSRFRPLESNNSPDWSARYTQARNFYFTHITETGFAGIFALILLGIALFKTFSAEIDRQKASKSGVFDTKVVSLMLLFTFFAFFPASSPEVILLTFVGLALVSKGKKIKIGAAILDNKEETKTLRLPTIVLGIPVLLGIFYLMFVSVKLLHAEYIYKAALDHLAKNEGSKGYETLQSAININPFVDRYHITYSQTNFLLANSLAQKGGLTETERQTMAKLVEQSIREAKAAVKLNSQKSSNWENLGNTYKNIMTLSKDAPKFAIQSYNQAIVLDPLNPNLRIALGGIWYALENFEAAVDAFRLAVLSKPDYANARFNLGSAYRKVGDTDRAITEFKAVMALVSEDSEDYKTAKKELDALESEKSSTTTPQSNHSGPEPQSPTAP